MFGMGADARWRRTSRGTECLPAQRRAAGPQTPPLIAGGASPSSNDGNLLNRRPCQAVAQISVLVRGSGLTSCSMSLPAVIIVEGMPLQLQAAAHMARTDARRTAAAGEDRARR